jgi:hypothetical protein
MDRNLKELINFALLAGSLFALTEIGSSILKEIKKLRKKLKFLKEFKNREITNNSNENKYFSDINKKNSEISENSQISFTPYSFQEIKNLNHDDYVIIKGISEKIYPRHGSYIDKNVIVSIGNSTYIEDFILKNDLKSINPKNIKNQIENFLIQPYPGTRMHNLKTQYLTKSNNFWDKFCKFVFFAPSQTISDKDQLYIFGKLNKNPNDISSEFSNYFNIKPKEISGLSLKNLKYYLKEKHTTNIFFQSLLFIIISGAVYFHIKFFIYPSIKNMLNTIKYRSRILCITCNREPCNTLCEKCYNLTEYCEYCYINLQEKINREQIKLEDIKCLFCGDVLDSCQKLLNSNAIN